MTALTQAAAKKTFGDGCVCVCVGFVGGGGHKAWMLSLNVARKSV